jgi:hypothetical protein
LINNVFEIEKKAAALNESNSILRNVNKIREILEHDLTSPNSETTGLIYHNPLYEDYNETRTDCEANIAGTSTENLVITEVIKPIVRLKKGGLNIIVQRGIVIAESKK